MLSGEPARRHHTGPATTGTDTRDAYRATSVQGLSLQGQVTTDQIRSGGALLIDHRHH
jgi:hypothetical protein